MKSTPFKTIFTLFALLALTISCSEDAAMPEPEAPANEIVSQSSQININGIAVTREAQYEVIRDINGEVTDAKLLSVKLNGKAMSQEGDKLSINLVDVLGLEGAQAIAEAPTASESEADCELRRTYVAMANPLMCLYYQSLVCTETYIDDDGVLTTEYTEIDLGWNVGPCIPF